MLPVYGKSARDTSTLLPLSAPLQDHWEHHSIPLLLDQFSASPGGSRFYGYSDFLPDLYRQTYEKSCLLLATNAVARAYLTNQTHSAVCLNDQAQVYGKALRSTNQALQDQFEGIQDATVVAVWLLGIHEVSGTFH